MIEYTVIKNLNNEGSVNIVYISHIGAMEKYTIQLQQIVKHAYTTTPFYMNLKRDDILGNITGNWGNFPLTYKENIILQGDSFISSHYMSQYLQRKLLRIHTSGSTGKCTEVYWNLSDNSRSMFPLWIKRKKYYQINPHDRYCYFFTGTKQGETDIETEEIEYSYGFCKSNLNEEKLIRIWNQMREYNPKWLILQPCMGILLSQIVEKHNLDHITNLRYIELTGEMLFPPSRMYIEKNLNAKTANQYGCCEMNSIAYECPEGHLHCMDENVHIEILDDNGHEVPDGEEGNIYLTTLRNYVMPLIRYQIGDRGKLLYQDCKCGNHSPILELTNGRTYDWIVDNNGELINSYIFVRCVENINMMHDDTVIYQFQIIQHQISEFTVKLVIDNEFAENEIRNLFVKNLWQSSLSGAAIKFIFYPHLFPDEKRGKLKWFINEMDVTKMLRGQSNE